MSKGGLPSIGMLAVPILSLVMSPVKAAILLLPIYVISDVFGVWLYRKDFSASNLKILIPASLLGVFIGWLTAAVTSDTAIKFALGFLGIGFCLNTWLRKTSDHPPQEANVKKGVFWGALSGFTSFISHAGAPPFQIYVLPQKLSKAQFAGTATILFAIINFAKIVPYQNLRPYSDDDLMAAAYLIPFAIAGAFAGAYLTKKIADYLFFRLIQIGLFLISCRLIFDAVKVLL
ncbi:MAG: sulfite exporter TauE/SafE family protein [Burkholderiales bacterium]|nr:sulfite exporter TauE/SafE family protein [Burkholderiales bacterium]